MGWLWRVAVLVGWIGALIGLLALDHDAYLYVWGGSVLTVAVGALLDRWWVVAAPVVVTLVIVGLILAFDSDCSGCAYDGSDYFALWLPTLLFGVPGVVAMAAGVGARRLVRRVRGREPGY